MRFTNRDAFESYVTLTALRETGKLGFAISKNRRKIETELQEYLAKRDELIRAYGEPSENGLYSMPERNATAFREALAPYDGIVCDVPVMTVDYDTFCSGGLTSDEMYILDWMAHE